MTSLSRFFRLLSAVAAVAVGLFCTAFTEKKPVNKDTAPGWHKFSVKHRHNGRDRRYTVHYYLPKHGDPAKMPVLMVLHGAGGGNKKRNPGALWQTLAEHHGFVIIAPAYTTKDYPAAAYQHVGLSKTWETLELLPKEEWTAMTVERAFDLVREKAALEAEDYYLYGMSGGGQFGHRFLMAVPEARVRRAVLGSPGTWTFPSLDGNLDNSGKIYDWPVSMRNFPNAKENLKAALQKDVIVILGADDNKPIRKSKNPDHHFMATPGAMAEGAGRCDRGKNAFAAARKTAEALQVPFNWKLIVLDNVGHSNPRIVRGTDEEIKGKIKPEQCTELGAYHQLFHDVPRQ